MPISSIFQYKFYSDGFGCASKQPSKLRWSFWFQILVIILILSLSTNSLAENPDSSKTTGKNNIATIINKVINKKAPDQKNDQAGGNALSRIVSSLVKKNDNLSLMFDASEIIEIEQALYASKNKQPLHIDTEGETITGSGANSCIYLESILYNSPDNWAVWINGQKISDNNNKIDNEIYIKSINPSNVDIVWAMSIRKWKILSNQKTGSDAPISSNNLVELDFNLSFNQTYVLAGKKIIEGRTCPHLVAGNDLESQQDN